MITVDEALERVRAACPPPVSTRSATTAATGSVLAAAVCSDVDVPPFDKAMMDGYAVRVADAVAPLRVIGTVTAGGDDAPSLKPGTAVRVMTGARVPPGADAVVMIERTQVSEDQAEVVVEGPLTFEQHIQRQGALVTAGDAVLDAGKRIRAEHLGALIEAGAHEVTVFARPSVAVLATGDELVEPSQQPGRNQIRNTNGPMLAGLCHQAGLAVTDLGIARDDPAALRAKIAEGLKADIFLLSGGVSAGDLDLVPKILSEVGVTSVFHRVRIKPGKPLWFGTSETNTLVFGLPGNPVSSLVGFRLFVRAAIDRMSGREDELPLRAALGENFQNRGDRETLFPARTVTDEMGSMQVFPVNWRGSADLTALLHADGFIRFAAGERTDPAGKVVPIYPF